MHSLPAHFKSFCDPPTDSLGDYLSPDSGQPDSQNRQIFQNWLLSGWPDSEWCSRARTLSRALVMNLLFTTYFSTNQRETIDDLDLSSLPEGDIITKQNRQKMPNIIFGFFSSTEYQKRHFSRLNSWVCRIQFPALCHTQLTRLPTTPSSHHH